MHSYEHMTKNLIFTFEQLLKQILMLVTTMLSSITSPVHSRPSFSSLAGEGEKNWDSWVLGYIQSSDSQVAPIILL